MAAVPEAASKTVTPTLLTSSGVSSWIAQGGEGGEGAAPAFQNKLTGTALLNALRQGGYIIFFRHGQTEIDYADQITAKMGYCNTQRMLSEVGWQQARTIGKAFQSLKIPVGQVYSSEYCRAWQTADLAFGTYQKRPGLNFAPAEEYTEAQIQEMRRGIMPLLTAVPPAKTNTIIVGHDDVFDAATGIYPEPQGAAYILKPSGNGSFEILARVLPDEWAKLGQ
ncbi:histidine phosphatase family protein [Thermosynechococcaceae cyanobacterium BACA0444]|uniref:Histidine phosphatase family protein n=1 Tax=Pseudocalidococcus azoricus BACA0444 TaxID=2918990 RepID=A0AAE4FRB2_9CYAN|nr:histidine phosphatase family protein [Pseudocalidococcus azoricus]MDS3859832.1 histidine phosphatase family protein [Pseudocalidococcus azoricus BACA0444]